jgi:hypothetical protein
VVNLVNSSVANTLYQNRQTSARNQINPQKPQQNTDEFRTNTSVNKDDSLKTINPESLSKNTPRGSFLDILA